MKLIQSIQTPSTGFKEVILFGLISFFTYHTGGDESCYDVEWGIAFADGMMTIQMGFRVVGIDLNQNKNFF